MKWFVNLKTSHKLWLGFGLCLTLSVVVGALAIVRMGQINVLAQDIITDSLDGTEALGRFQVASSQFRTIEYRYAMSANESDRAKAVRDLDRNQADADKALDDYGATINDPTDSRNLAELKSAWQMVQQSKDKVVGANGIAEKAALLNGPLKDQYFQVLNVYHVMMDWNEKQGEVYGKDGARAFESARQMVIELLIVAVILGCALAYTITRYITKSLTNVIERLERLQRVCITGLSNSIKALEHGDLTVHVEPTTTPLDVVSKDELGHLAATFNTVLGQMKDAILSFGRSQSSLKTLITEIRSSANQVDSAAGSLALTSQSIAAASEEITATMQEVSSAADQSARAASEVARGSETQAMSITESSELVKHLTLSVQRVADDSAAAESAAVEASKAAQVGRESVRDTVSGMHEIQRTISDTAQVIHKLGDSSKQIGTIVQTIEEIAEQTNLLALNAAIEAARAGEAGRGFAVVADEVRKLAERSATATKEIGALISSVQSQTDQAVTAMVAGVKTVEVKTAIAEKAGDALSQIHAVVESVTERVHKIYTEAGDMTASADEVSRSMYDVAAVVEESSAAAEEMSASAEQVSASVATVATTTQEQSSAAESLMSSSAQLTMVSSSLAELISQFEIGTPETKTYGGLTMSKAA